MAEIPVKLIAGRLREGRCVPFLGAAVNVSDDDRKYSGLPLGVHVAESLSNDLADAEGVGEIHPEEKPLLVYKIHGSFFEKQKPPGAEFAIESSPLIVTEDDYIDFISVLSDSELGVPQVVRMLMSYSTLLFLGYSLEDWDFRALYKSLVLSKLTPNGTRKSIAIQKSAAPDWQKFWTKRDVDIYDEHVYKFAEMLAEATNEPAANDHPDRCPRPAVQVPRLLRLQRQCHLQGAPHRSRDPALRHRDGATRGPVRAHGKRKSSLINAGVRPRLEALDYRTFYIRVERDPIKSCREMLRLHHVPLDDAGASFDEALTKAAATRPIVLFFDQFEEFFIYVAKEQPAQAAAFIRTVGALHRNRTSGVHLVKRIERTRTRQSPARSELLSFRGMHRLERFDPFVAREILQRGIALSGFQIDPAAVDAVISGLSAGSDTVEPVLLQIVGRRLFEIARTRSKNLTLSDIEREDGSHDALRRHVDDAITGAAARSGVKELRLRQWLATHLISSAGTRAMVSDSELRNADVPLAAVDALRTSRILHAEHRHGMTWYELAHDSLVGILQDARDKARRKSTWWKR